MKFRARGKAAISHGLGKLKEVSDFTFEQFDWKNPEEVAWYIPLGKPHLITWYREHEIPLSVVRDEDMVVGVLHEAGETWENMKSESIAFGSAASRRPPYCYHHFGVGVKEEKAKEVFKAVIDQLKEHGRNMNWDGVSICNEALPADVVRYGVDLGGELFDEGRITIFPLEKDNY